MGSVFKFKKFEVNQSGCAMKINTDGVLLGAIAAQEGAKQILDIGTGTGVIAMMLAQRFEDAQVDAVEIDEQAALAAKGNFNNSVFAANCNAHHNDISLFQTDRKYDLVVSNPPYFVNDLKNQEHRKGIARHAGAQFFESMLKRVAELLDKSGSFWFILPVKQAEYMVKIAFAYGLSPSVVVHLHSDDSKPEFRWIVCLDYTGQITLHKNLNIYETEGVYTATYKQLLKDFFLAF
ncbi:MAG: methyltransferase [Candidatus Pedobacter colombiensis]|uniref:tRNA1(Val) (adenine(37)-N6)-methyltransferase n=1 Tax=Candidatus Pedobacter colombiensis TaxID=3121371 RepID=A0AAJ5W7N4_9SPHI|nr:methyltransferase [Pedobacter sp.]WEK18042.1 MAG: methyltransferase [Pedobacter sp.]